MAAAESVQQEAPRASDEPAYRGFAVEVVRARRLSPSFLRMTFTGPELDEIAGHGLDQRIKLVLPAACGARVDADLFARPDWYTHWQQKPDAEREPLRTYTLRAVRPHEREIDVDVVLHGVRPGTVTTRGCGLAELLGCACSAQAGPAVRWCAAARRGDPIVVVGPNARWAGEPVGVEWRPPEQATTFLLAGDETAVPAICSIVESLPAEARGDVVLEVPTSHDELDLDAPAGVTVHWLARSTPTETITMPHGMLLSAAVKAVAPRLVAEHRAGVDPEEVDVDQATLWEVPTVASTSDGLYAWVAGEAAVVTGLRRFLVRDLGLDRRAVAFMGYWRAGRSEG